MDIGMILGIFVRWPLIALLPAAFFGWFYFRLKRTPLLVAALAWLAYFPYEQAMKMRLLCSGECNIRVDLLLFYPALLIVSGLAVKAVLRAKREAKDPG